MSRNFRLFLKNKKGIYYPVRFKGFFEINFCLGRVDEEDGQQLVNWVLADGQTGHPPTSRQIWQHRFQYRKHVPLRTQGKSLDDLVQYSTLFCKWLCTALCTVLCTVLCTALCTLLYSALCSIVFSIVYIIVYNIVYIIVYIIVYSFVYSIVYIIVYIIVYSIVYIIVYSIVYSILYSIVYSIV